DRCMPCVEENGLLPGRGPLDLEPGGRGTAEDGVPRPDAGPGLGTAVGLGASGGDAFADGPEGCAGVGAGVPTSEGGGGMEPGVGAVGAVGAGGPGPVDPLPAAPEPVAC